MARMKEDRNKRRMKREEGRTDQSYYQSYRQDDQQVNYGRQGYYQQPQGDMNGRQDYYQQSQGDINGQQSYYTQGNGMNGQQNYYTQGNSADVRQSYYSQENMNDRQGYYQQAQGNMNGRQGYYQQNPNQGYYQQPYTQQEMAASRAKSKKRKTKRRILFAFEIIILIVLAAGLYVAATLSRIEKVDIKEEEIQSKVQEQLPQQTAEKLKGYWNLALYGVDSRDADENGLSDTIMVCSINRDTKEVKLASVYRDTYLDNSNGEFYKATEVYIMGGAERSINMLNKNLDLDISDFVTVNMNVVADVVDFVGGVEIDVREDELIHLNNYQVEGSEITGREITPVYDTGLQTLNGLQALSYCRIRYTSPIDDEHPGLDYERTLRQRTVLTKVLEKVQKMDILKLTGFVEEILPSVSTSLSQTEILSLAKDVASYRLVDTTGFPYDKTTMDTDAGDCVVPVNLAENVTELHKFLFGAEDYTPSATVQEISNEIANRTGVY